MATRHRLRNTGFVTIVCLGAVVIYLAFFFIEGMWSEGTLNECGRDEAVPTSTIDVDWRWWPPGYDCVFLDDAGKEVARRVP